MARKREPKRPPPQKSPEWTGDEPCRRVPEVFHPEVGDYQAAAIAKWICGRCPSQQRCLAWALSDPTLEGIHAGTTKQQRAKIRGQIRRAS